MAAFAAGMWTTHKSWLPWQAVTELRQSWHTYRRTGMLLPHGTYIQRKDDMSDLPYEAFEPDRITPGYVLINRLQLPEHEYVSELFDTEGKMLHRWRIDYSQMVDGGNPSEFNHIATALPDGSLLVNFDDATALARIDACGTPLWALTDQVYHHSIRPDETGYWTWRSARWDGGHDQTMLRFDIDTGAELEAIDLVDDVITGDAAAELAMTIPEDFRYVRGARDESEAVDIFHPNDVEPLPAEFADAFPQFEAGDLLMSLRNIHTLAVVDRKTRKLKWHQTGPWRDQHDADWHADGTITMFSNNIDRGRTSIMRVDPKTGATEDIFRGTGFRFNSYIMGQHQLLPGGNWLITAPLEGRVIEVAADGTRVREFNNVLDDTYNGIVTYGEHLPPDYFDTLPACTN